MSNKYYQKRAPVYSPHVMRWLEARNFENMVYFYQTELKHVIRTGKKHPGIPSGAYRVMCRTGILTRSKGSRRNSVHFSVSPRAMKIIEKSKELTKMSQKMPARALENALSGRIDPHGESRVTDVQEVEPRE